MVHTIPQHLEGDVIAGSCNGFIATLVERNTRYVMLAKVSTVASQFNARPPMTLGYETSPERFNACVAPIS